MEPFVSFTDRIGGFWKGAWRSNVARQNPVNTDFLSRILLMDKMKQLHQEAFSELLKIADRQKELESMLLYGKGWPSNAHKTQMKGIIDVVGLLLFSGKDFQQSCDSLQRARIKTGINARLIFETAVKRKDVLVAEFLASHDHPFVLESLLYNVHLKAISSVVSIALGAKGDNFAICSNRKQRHCCSGFSPFGPPLFSQQHTGAAGIMLKRLKIRVSLAGLFSGIGLQHDAVGERSCLSTFSQVSYRPYDEVTVNVSGLWQTPVSGIIKFGMLAVPLNGLKVHTGSDVPRQGSSSTIMTQKDSSLTNSAASVAMMINTEIGEGTKLGVWLEAQKANPGIMMWGVSFADTPYEEAGWGLKLRGTVKERLYMQMEGFLRFNLGKNIVLQPGLVYVAEQKTKTPAFIFQSSWCM